MGHTPCRCTDFCQVPGSSICRERDVSDLSHLIKDVKKCPTCEDSDRPGFIVVGEYFDRLVETDVLGEYKLTSGKEYMRCMNCSGTGIKED